MGGKCSVFQEETSVLAKSAGFNKVTDSFILKLVRKDWTFKVRSAHTVYLWLFNFYFK